MENGKNKERTLRDIGRIQLKDKYDRGAIISPSEMTNYIHLKIGLGKKAAREFAENAGALIKNGRHILFDRDVLDKAMEQIKHQERTEQK